MLRWEILLRKENEWLVFQLPVTVTRNELISRNPYVIFSRIFMLKQLGD